MNTLTVKIPPSLDAAVAQASAQAHVSKSELVRRALDAYLRQRDAQPPFESALDQAGDLVGCFTGGPMLFVSALDPHWPGCRCLQY